MPVNPFDRWSDFSFILENTEENFTYEIFRPSSRIEDETGSAFEILTNVEFGYDGMWIYPIEALKHTVGGSVYTVEVIFLLKPNVDVRQLDFIVRKDREDKVYRVLGVDDFKSHLEVSCYAAQLPKVTLERIVTSTLLSTTGTII